VQSMTIEQYEIEIILTSSDEKMDSFIGGSYKHMVVMTESQFFFFFQNFEHTTERKICLHDI